MERLPTPLICITLQGIIDDPDAVEGVLAEDERAEKCFPLVLKEVLKMQSISDSATLLKYLHALWYDLPTLAATPHIASTPGVPNLHIPPDITSIEQSQYEFAASNGLVYLLPYINANPSEYLITLAYCDATLADQYEAMFYLTRLRLSRSINGASYIVSNLSAFAREDDVPKTLTELQAMSDLPKDTQIAILKAVIYRMFVLRGPTAPKLKSRSILERALKKLESL